MSVCMNARRHESAHAHTHVCKCITLFYFRMSTRRRVFLCIRYVCVCMHLCMYLRACVRAYIYTYIYNDTHTHTHAYIYIYIYIYMHRNVCMCMGVCVLMPHACLCACQRACSRADVHVCIYENEYAFVHCVYRAKDMFMYVCANMSSQGCMHVRVCSVHFMACGCVNSCEAVHVCRYV